MRTCLLWMGAMILTFVAGCATAEKPQPARVEFQSKTLPNGLRVITVEDFACPVVAVHVWYHVGAADDNPARQGFAHMFEHMMFRGTDRLGPKDHFEWIHRSGGDCNGYTAFDQTVYTNRVPANQLGLALWLEAERMGQLKIDEKGYETERDGAVSEERRMGLNQPYGTVFEKLLPAVFPKHPYRWLPIGQIPHLRAAGVEELRAFWQRYYVPNNATLVIVGAVKHADAQALAERYLGWVNRKADPPRVAAANQPLDGPKTLTLAEPKGPVPMVGLVYRTVPMAHPDCIPLQFLANTLGDGASCRLHLDLVRRQKLATDVGAGLMALERGGQLTIRAMLAPGADPDKVLAELERHVRQISTEPISQTEWTKAQNQMLRSEVTALMTVSGKASVVGRYAVLYGDLGRINRRLAEIRAVTPDDVLRVAKTYLVPGRQTTLIVKPDPKAKLDVPDDAAPPASQPAVAAQTDGRTPRPVSFPASAPVEPLLDKMPPIAHVDRTLANGLRVVVVPDHRVPFVRMTLGLKFGSFSEDPAKAGAASMAARLITHGTKNYSAEKLAEELELHAITLEGHASMDVAEVQADCLTEHVERTAKLLAEVVLTPTFPAEEFDLLRTQLLNDLRVKTQSAEYLAEREFRKRMFGDHPYARTATGEPEDVLRLTQADVAAWWNTFVRPDAAVLYIAGDIEPQAGFSLAEKALAVWKASGPLPQIKLPDPPALAGTHIYLVNRPGVQSEIRIGHISIKRDHPDYFTTRVLTQYFGGAFSSRLNQSVRIAKGLTYGIGGSFVPERLAGTFRIRTFTKTERTAETVQAALDELKVLQDVPPTPEEMNIAQSYLVGSFAGGRETPQAVVNDLWMLDSCGLPADFLDRYLAEVGKSKPADSVRVARELVHPGQLVIVVAGDAAAVKDSLEKIAPVTVIEPKPFATSKPD